MRDFPLRFDAASVYELRCGQSQRFAVGPVGDAALFLCFLPRLLRLLELHHRDRALLLDDRLRRLLHKALGWQNAPDDDAIDPQ